MIRRPSALIEARLWLTKYAPGYYSLEMTDAEVERAMMAVGDLVQPHLQDLIRWLDENVPAWHCTACAGRGGRCDA